MTHQSVSVPHVLYDDKTPAPLSQEQILEILSNLVPHMPRESQTSFLAMFCGDTLALPFRKSPKIRIPPHLALSLDVVRSVVRAKAYVRIS